MNANDPKLKTKKLERKDNKVASKELILLELKNYSPMGMFQVLSQVKVIVPLLEMIRIDEHNNKIVSLINSIVRSGKDKVVID